MATPRRDPPVKAPKRLESLAAIESMRTGKPVDIVLLSAALNRAMLDRAANKRYDHGRASPISTGALEIGANI